MMNTNRSIIVFSTWRSPILVPYLRALHEVGIPVASIVFDGERNERSAQIHRDRTRGFFEDESIFELEDMGIPGYFVKNHNAKPSTDLLGHLGADIIINGGVPRILKPQLLAAASTGVVNSHPGLLPKYRGATSLEWALRNDDPLGATCHFMNEEIDAGPIVYREEMPVYCGQPYEELRARIIGHSARVMATGITLILEKDLLPDRMEPTPTDSYFSVIPDTELDEAKRRLTAGEYSHYADLDESPLPKRDST